FLAVFRHLHLGRDRSNLQGWLFQVAHNLALKQRRRQQRRSALLIWNDAPAYRRSDHAPTPEARLLQRRSPPRLRAGAGSLSEGARRCLRLRAEGLTYRDIAKAMRLSLGAVAKAMTRAMTRLVNADGG